MHMMTAKNTKKMTPQRFSWRGQNRAGGLVAGVLYGADKDSIRAQLAQRGVVALRIFASREPWRKPIAQPLITLFLQEFSTLYSAGVGVLRIFDVLLHSSKNPAFQSVVQSLQLDVARGESLHLAMRHHPRVFDELTCNLIESGERSGKLSAVLRNIVYTAERRQQLASQILTAMVYPVFIILSTLLVWVAVLGWVVPVFEAVYKNGGKQLPWITQFLLDASQNMRTHGVFIAIGLIGVGIFLFNWQNRRWRYALDVFKFKLPVFGKLLKTALNAQFARVFSLLHDSGVPLHEALQLTGSTAGYLPMQRAAEQSAQHVLNGYNLSVAMARHPVFETSLVQRVQIGEESGALTLMLEQYATHNEFLVEQMVKRLSALIEPMLILLIGAMVVVMVVALYLPILDLGSALR
jgi:type IV pilus assembly protein PilC